VLREGGVYTAPSPAVTGCQAASVRLEAVEKSYADTILLKTVPGSGSAASPGQSAQCAQSKERSNIPPLSIGPER
jgi:hypothetical protein